MQITNSVSLSFLIASIATILGLIAFVLNWNFFDGNMSGYQILLFPGNLTLTYIWHPLFTEELNFWLKLKFLLFGQFGVVLICTRLILKALKG